MSELHAVQQNEPERALLVGVSVRGTRPLLGLDDSLSELALLADTAGMEVIGLSKQNLPNPDPATFVGSGKVDEIRDILLGTGAKTVIFDDELSPRHQRELEKRLGEDIKVLDRSALILDIFAQHARTREGALQVELAQYEYRLPRLTRQWTHLARQTGGGAARGGSGGVGLRGPGETQLEVDRRDIRNRISHLKSELQHVREHRLRHRSQRDRSGVPLIALVGYTNAGKSTLLRALSGADVYIADQLFATLDPTTRRVALPSGRQVLVTDTVGFIQRLPTTLIASFRATLEEIRDADLLLEVVDASHPNVLQHLETVEDTLAEIDIPPIPRLIVWNKVDLLRNSYELPPLNEKRHAVGQVAVSAGTGLNMDKLGAALESALSSLLYQMTLLLPYERGDLVSLLHESASVEKQEHTENGILLSVKLPVTLYNRCKPYRYQD
jgi:GTP-binding protein HflX